MSNPTEACLMSRGYRPMIIAEPVSAEARERLERDLQRIMSRSRAGEILIISEPVTCTLLEPRAPTLADFLVRPR